MTLARRTISLAAVVALLAAGMVVVGAVVARPGGNSDVVQPASAPAAEAAGGIDALQSRLARVPGDYPGWAALAMLYVDRARVTADPSWYAKARSAVDQSLEVQPEENAAALTALATLQAAQHEFRDAVQTARQALAINAYDSTAYGVLADALTELGLYDEAADALQKMADVRPGFPALTRISYARELRGDVAGARAALEQALTAAPRPEDAGFALLYLGELSWNYDGDAAAAGELYARGLRRDPTSLPLQAAAARAAAAQGRTEDALAAYAEVVSRVPVQQYLVEYGELLSSQGREDEAREQYDVVRAANTLLEQSGSVVDLETALFEADHGDPARALAAAQAAYDRGASIFAADALAWALHVNGRDREALQYSEQALALGVRPAAFLFHKGMIEAALGSDDAAIRDLREALDVNPHFSVRHGETARATLARLGG